MSRLKGESEHKGVVKLVKLCFSSELEVLGHADLLLQACTWQGLSVAITNTFDYQRYTQIARCRQYTVPLCRIGLPLCSSLYIVFTRQSLVQLSVMCQGKALPPEKTSMHKTTLKLSELAPG